MEVRTGFRKARTYGKKTGGPSRDKAAIFATDSPLRQRVPTAIKIDVADAENSVVPGSSQVAARQPLTDVTNELDRICLDGKKTDDEAKAKGKAKNIEPLTPIRTRSGLSARGSLKRADEKYKWLGPLTTVYAKEGRQGLTLQKWRDILLDGCAVEKIAESSYAEVFKITNDRGTSILKLMALKPPTGRGSRRDTAVTADSIVSEVFIMDLMADIPGFMEFKEAWVIEGQPSQQIISAFEKFETAQKSEFAHPEKYPKDQIFLALELGDAGTDIEHFKITCISQIWDVILKVVAALATGEQEYGFEHRDLHEGNVCVKQTIRPKAFDSNKIHKFGYSGLEVTLLDYTLSRAHDKLGFVAYRDLEQDRTLFNSSDSLQSRIYQMMRASNCFGMQTFTDLAANKKGKIPRGAWREFNPYSNVLWIYYMLDFLVKNYKGTESLASFMGESQELRRKLDPMTQPRGAFNSACDVLEFCEEQGWITPAESLDPTVNNATETVNDENEEAVYDPSTESSSSSDSDALYMRCRNDRQS